MIVSDYSRVEIFKAGHYYFAQIPSKPGQIVQLKPHPNGFDFEIYPVIESLPPTAKKVDNQNLLDTRMRVFDKIWEELEKLV